MRIILTGRFSLSISLLYLGLKWAGKTWLPGSSSC
uniref:Uncharacterized protein n=1 Tax=Anguilla anguilla TaxID=7936 RepID=A0A0E9U075_ANGAN